MAFGRGLMLAALAATAVATDSHAAAAAADADANSSKLRRQLNFWDPSPTASPTPSRVYTLDVNAPPVGTDTAIFGQLTVTPFNNFKYSDYKALVYIGTNTTDNSGIVKFWGPKPASNSNWRLDDSGKFTASDWVSGLPDLVSPFVLVVIVKVGTPIPTANGLKGDQLIALFNVNHLLTFTVVTRTVPYTCTITRIPLIGTLGPIIGQCTGLPDFADKYRLAVYVRNAQGNIFGSKPTFGATFPLEVDGSFRIFDWPSHPNDIYIPCFVLVLVPAGYKPKDCNGQLQLDNSLVSYTYWFIEICRDKQYSSTPSPTATRTVSPSRTASPTSTPATRTPTPSVSPSRSPSRTVTPSIGFTTSVTVTPTVSPSPTVTPGRTCAFVEVIAPAIGSKGPISGTLVRLPGDEEFWSVCLYVQSQVNGQWWGPKPQYVDPKNGGFSCVQVSANGGFYIENWATDFLDATVDTLGLFVVPLGARPLPVLTGQLDLPQKLLDWSICYIQVVRPRTTTIDVVVPRLGTTSAISGVVRNPVSPASSYGVCAYVFNTNGGWFGPKPIAGSLFPLAADYSFTINSWASGFGDSGVPIIAVFLVPAGFQAPNVNGSPTLPEYLLKLQIHGVQTQRLA